VIGNINNNNQKSESFLFILCNGVKKGHIPLFIDKITPLKADDFRHHGMGISS